MKGLLRAGAYLVSLSLVLGVFQLRHARAEVADRTVELGRQMARLADATQHDVNKLVLNGQTMFLGSSIAKDSAANVLDRYESYCTKNNAQPVDAWRELANKSDASVDKAFLSTGTLRGGNDREGTVVCFVKTPASKPTIAEAVGTFARTGELGALGAVRYAYARTTEKGKTLVLTAWTDDRFNLQELMPQDGKDVPGEEFDAIPPVPSTSRVFSARVDRTPFGMNVYRGNDAPDKVATFYDTEMERRGWVAFDPEMEKREHDGDGPPPVGRLYEKDGVVLTLASKIEEGATFTALGLAGATGGAASARSFDVTGAGGTGAEAKPPAAAPAPAAATK